MTLVVSRTWPMPSRRLRERREGPVDVYASFNPDADGKQNAEQLWKEHAQDLYRSVLDGLWTYAR